MDYNQTIDVESTMPEEDTTELIQYLTAGISIICALTTYAAYYTRPKWRKHNYMYAKQIIINCAAIICMLLIIVFPEDLTPRDTLLVVYFIPVIISVVGTGHIVILGHLHVGLKCEELQDEETIAAYSWHYFTMATAILLLIIKSILKLDIETVISVAGIQLSAITTGNVILLSKLLDNVERKCRLIIMFMFCVISLCIFCDVLLILYGGLLLTGDDVSIIHDCLKLACTGVVLLKSVLIFCSKDGMDWKNCRFRNAEEIEMLS